jgi:AcrR family transcriptional regulator
MLVGKEAAMTSPVRQTSAEIDRAILDAAARTFAVHGYAKTSVQQLADAVGYSKAGLLHRFASKQALYDAVVAEAGGAVEEILDGVAGVPAGPARIGRTLELVAARALDRPGLVHLLVASVRPASDEPGRLALHARLLDLAGALGTRPDDTRPDDTRPDDTRPDDTRSDAPRPDAPRPDAPRPDDPRHDAEHRLRVSLALRLIVDAVLAQDDALLRLDRARLQPLLVDLAAGVLGPAARSTSSGTTPRTTV